MIEGEHFCTVTRMASIFVPAAPAAPRESGW